MKMQYRYVLLMFDEILEYLIQWFGKNYKSLILLNLIVLIINYLCLIMKLL